MSPPSAMSSLYLIMSCLLSIAKAITWSNIPTFSFNLSKDEIAEEKFYVGYHQRGIAKYLNISLRQSRSFVFGDEKVFDATQGTSLIDNISPDEEIDVVWHNKSVFLWCGNTNPSDNKRCYWQFVRSARKPLLSKEVRYSEGGVADIRDVWDFKFHNWTVPQPVFVKFHKANGDKQVDDVIRGEDARVMLAKDRASPALLIIVSRHVEKLKVKQTFFGYLHLNKSVGTLETHHPLSQISIAHESGVRHQKNWSPFYYKHPTSGLYGLYFIYTSIPHRIVSVNESVYSLTGSNSTLDNEDGLMFGKKIHANTVCLTNNSQIHWTYGEVRGGTQAELVSLNKGGGGGVDDDMRYLTFFHSSCTHTPHTSTYFLGAYLFEAHPPFAITHFSKEPIIDFVMYNETFGWCYKTGHPDFSIMPLTFVVRDRSLILAWAKNVYSGRLTYLDLDGMLKTHFYQVNRENTTVTINKIANS